MKKNNNFKKIVIAIIIFIIFLVIYSIVINKNTVNYSKLSDDELEEVVSNKIEDINKNELGNLGERERIEYYLSEFISAIENNNYDVAYQMLYGEFKDKYFPNFSDFEEYAKTKFPSMVSLKHTNIERNGDTYILWITISNPLAGKKSEKEMNFVIRENGLNDFELSFSVI